MNAKKDFNDNVSKGMAVAHELDIPAELKVAGETETVCVQDEDHVDGTPLGQDPA